MRILEVILSSFIIVFALAFVVSFAITPSSPRYEITELEKLGYNILHDLDEQGLLGRFVFNKEWANLTVALMVSFPPDVYFDLTVRYLNGSLANANAPIRYGSLEVFENASFVASVTYVVPGYQAMYDPRTLTLRMVRL